MKNHEKLVHLRIDKIKIERKMKKKKNELWRESSQAHHQSYVTLQLKFDTKTDRNSVKFIDKIKEYFNKQTKAKALIKSFKIT